jgi:hypothetical protein
MASAPDQHRPSAGVVPGPFNPGMIANRRKRSSGRTDDGGRWLRIAVKEEIVRWIRCRHCQPTRELCRRLGCGGNMSLRVGIALRLRAIAAVISSSVMLLAWPAASVFAQSSEFDDWQGFKPGSWSEVRTITEGIDPAGTSVASRSVSVTRKILVNVDKDSVTLRVEKWKVDPDGAETLSPAATLVLRPYGRQDDEKVVEGKPEAVEIEVGGQKFAGRSVKAQLSSENGSRDVLTTFRDEAVHAPLRRVVTVYEADGKVRDTTTTEAVSVDGFATVAQRAVPTTHYRVVYQNHKLTSTSLVDKSVDVPGQVVRATIAEREASGTLRRFVTQELVGFHVARDEVSTREAGSRRRERIEARRERREIRRSSP